MTQLIELLARYSNATNIPLPIDNNFIDLGMFFYEALNRGYLSVEVFEELNLLIK